MTITAEAPEIETTELKIRSNYFDIVMDDPDRVIAEAKAQLEDVDFDTFVVTGMSGVSVASLLAKELGKTYLILRKPDDLSTHSSRRAVGRLGRRWVFLDDFTCSGDTRSRVMRQLAELLMHEREQFFVPDPNDTSIWPNGEYKFKPAFPTEYVGDYYYLANMVGPGRYEQVEDWNSDEWTNALATAEAKVKL